jgi:hypothetical protein
MLPPLFGLGAYRIMMQERDHPGRGLHFSRTSCIQEALPRAFTKSNMLVGVSPGELEVVLAHPVIAPLLVERG